MVRLGPDTTNYLLEVFSNILNSVHETIKYFQIELISELLARILITVFIVLGKDKRG